MSMKGLLTKIGVWPFLVRTGLDTLVARIWQRLRHPHPEALIYQVELLNDYLAFKKRYGSFLHQGRNLADPNKKLLVLSFSNYVAQVKAESLLAKALQLRGYTPVIVTNTGCKGVLKYYRLFGIDQFVFFDKFLEGNKVSPQAVAEADAFFSRQLTVRDIKDYQYHGTRVGSHILRTFTRTTFQGSIDLSDPDTVASLKSQMLRGMHNVEQAEILLDNIQPGVIFTLHPLNLGEGDIYEVGLQRGINTINWDGAQKQDHWIFKRYTKENRGMQNFSLSDETWGQAKQITWNERYEAALMEEIKGRYIDLNVDSRRLQEGKKFKTKEEVQQQLGLDPRKKTAVVFSHIVWDTSFLHGVDLFDTYEEWLVETVRAACENPAVNWIIKLHPANIKKLRGNRVEGEPSEIVAIRNRIGDLPEHVKLLHSDTDINTWSLFELTDYCLTVRGTIGIEMSCFGIPVLTAGTGRYSHRGFTIDSATREEYLQRLHHIQDIPRMKPEEIELAKKHAYYLFLQRPVPIDIMRKIKRSNEDTGHPLATNYALKASTLSDIERSGNLNGLTRWVINSKESDFLVSHAVSKD
jgi:hypothetical protein